MDFFYLYSMGDSNTTTTKFIIKDKELFNNSLNPKNLKRYAVGYACVDAIDSMVLRIKNRDRISDLSFHIDVNKGESAIRKNIKSGVLTQQTLQAIICLFFHKFDKGHKYYQPYTIDDIYGFFSSLELVHNEPGSVIRFRNFFSILDIPDRFENFEIIIDENWIFEQPEKIDQNEDGSSDIQIKPNEESGKIERKRRTPKPITIYGFFILLGLIVLIGTIDWNSEKVNVIELTASENLEKFKCKLPKANNAIAKIIIIPIGEDEDTQKVLSNKLFWKIRDIVVKDSLPIDVRLCKAFNDLEIDKNLYSIEDPILLQKPYRDFLNFYKSFSTMISLEHRKKKHRFNITGDTSFQHFKKMVALTSQSQEISYQWDAEKVNYFAYYQIVSSLRHYPITKNTADKLLGYINKELLTDTLSKYDTKILITKSLINEKFYPNNFLADLEFILSLDPEQLYALREKADILFKLDNREAITYYTKYYKSRPAAYDAILGIAKCFAVFDGDYGKALSIINDSISESSQNLYSSLQTKADLLLLKRDYKSAIDYYQRAIMARTDNRIKQNFDCEKRIIQAYCLDNDFETAREKIEELFVLGPDLKSLSALLSLTHLKENDLDGAIKAATQYKFFSSDYHLDVIVAYLNLLKGYYPTALDYINRGIKKNPIEDDKPYVYNLRRVILNRVNRKELARIDSINIINTMNKDFFILGIHNDPLPFYGFGKVFDKIEVEGFIRPVPTL
tara:strand:+ start:380890 stop:383088 length:2199 start_codon:yes stop_codon:yes gene_type:complete